MVTAIYIFLFLAIWHFFYESVLATSFRHGLRYKFFKLRDELRSVKMDGLNKEDEKAYEILDNSICAIISSMSFISLGNYYKLKSNHNIEEFRKHNQKTRELLNLSSNSKLKNIDKEIGKLGSKVLIINNGAWLLYLFAPVSIILMVFVFTHQINKLTRKMVKISSRLIYSSDSIDGNSIIGLT